MNDAASCTRISPSALMSPGADVGTAGSMHARAIASSRMISSSSLAVNSPVSVTASLFDIFMPVSRVVGGLALPAYTGGRRLDFKQNGDHEPWSRREGPSAQRCESGGRFLHAGKALAVKGVRA